MGIADEFKDKAEQMKDKAQEAMGKDKEKGEGQRSAQDKDPKKKAQGMAEDAKDRTRDRRDK